MTVVDNPRAAMAEIRGWAGLGFVHHVSGLLSLDAAEEAVARFNARYGVNEADIRAVARERHEIARTRVVLWPEAESLAYALLATDGEGLVHQMVDLQDMRHAGARLRFRDYTLVPQRENVPSWTWQIQREKYQSLLRVGPGLLRNGHQLGAREFVEKLPRHPMFEGVRAQLQEVLWQSYAAGLDPSGPPLRLPPLSASLREACDPRLPMPLVDWLEIQRTQDALVHASSR